MKKESPSEQKKEMQEKTHDKEKKGFQQYYKSKSIKLK